MVQRFDIVNQLHRTVCTSRVTILTGPPGCGKTTAALHLLDRLHTVKSFVITGPVNAQGPFTPFMDESDQVVIVDDFLGKTSLDSYDKSKRIMVFLQYFIFTSLFPNTRYLLISRSSVLEAGLSTMGAELGLITGKCSVVHLSIDKENICKELLGTPSIGIGTATSDATLSIGFPLCCKLAMHLPEVGERFFQHPRRVLQEVLKRLMQDSHLARLALIWVAISENYLQTSNLVDPERFSRSLYEEVGTSMNCPYTLDEIVSFYRKTQGLVVVEEDFVSFASETIREEVLVVLCEWHAETVAKFCSLKLISQVALACLHEVEQAEGADMPMLSEPAILAFLDRILRELDARNYRETLTSPLFQHQSFRKKFEKAMQERALVDGWLHTEDRDGLPFLFWAGACELVLEKAWTCLKEENKENKENNWIFCPYLVGHCYWGREKAVRDVLRYLQNNLDLRKRLKKASLQDIVTGNLPGLRRRHAPDWKLAPFHPKDTLLTLAAWRGHDAVVKVLVERCWPVDSRGNNGLTALMHYCARANEDMVRYLLSKGADHLAADNRKISPLLYSVYRSEWNLPSELLSDRAVKATNILETPLTVACASGWSVPRIQEMIRQGANPSVPDTRGCNCLHYACFNGQVDLVLWLLEETEADVVAKSRFGDTPLELAVMSPGRARLVHSILKRRGDPAASDMKIPSTDAKRRSTTPSGKKEIVPNIKVAIMVASALSDSEVLKRFNESFTFNVEIVHEAIYTALSHGNSEAARFLLEKGYVLPKFDKVCRSCIEASCKSGSTDCVQLIVSRFHPKCRKKITYTILKNAIKFGQPCVASMMAQQEVPMQAESDEYPLLTYAALADSIQLMEWLIKEKKMDINAVDSHEQTPLFSAVENSRRVAIKYLLENGADPKKANDEGDTILHVVRLDLFLEELKYILGKEDPNVIKNITDNCGDTPLMNALRYGWINVVELFGLDKDSLNRTNDGGENCLELAVNSGNIELVKKCLPYFDKGVNTRCSENNTPLHLACEQNYVSMVEWLLSQEADEEAVNDASETALSCACKKGHVECAELLAMDQKLLTRENDDDKNCFHLAVESGNLELVATLPDWDTGLKTCCIDADTPLHLACNKGDVAMVEWLLNRGADQEAFNDWGETPLMCARQNGHVKVVEALERYLNH